METPGHWPLVQPATSADSEHYIGTNPFFLQIAAEIRLIAYIRIDFRHIPYHMQRKAAEQWSF